MTSFREYIQKSRSLINEGKYREAFDYLVNREPLNARDLFNKISVMVDTGYVLRDEKILNYTIYLLENHGEELAIVPDYAPYIYLNLGHQYANMGALYSYNNDHYGFYTESVLDRAKSCYHRALKQKDLTPILKKEIKASLLSVYTALGRRWEALEEVQDILELDSENLDMLNRKCSFMLEFAPYNPDNQEIIHKEVWFRINEVLENPEKKEDFPLFQKKKQWLDKHLQESSKDESESYPTNTLETEGDFQHFYVSFSVKHKLYLNVCSFCSRCDFAVGDRAVFDSRGVGINREEGSYYKLVSGYNRLKERYQAGRYILAVAHWKEGNLDFAEMLSPRAKLKDYQPMGLRDNLMETAYLIGWEILESMGSLLAIFLSRPDLSRDGLESLFYENGEIRDFIKKNPHPSLHAIYNIYFDLTRGMHRQLSWENRSLRVPFTDDLVLTQENQPLEESSLILYRQIRNMLIYMMTLFDSREFDLGKERDFDLFPFRMPDNLVYR